MGRVLILILLIISMIGCATQPEKIEKQSVSLKPYQDYSCKQIGMELDRVNRRIYVLHGDLKKTANNDAAQMAVGMACFWPALFFLEGGDDYRANEYSLLKGEKDALDKVAVQKECDPTKLPKFKDPEEAYRKKQKEFQKVK